MVKISNITTDYLFGKLPPQAIEVEEAILGALLLEKDAMSKVSLSAEMFYKDIHQIIFKSIEKLNREGKSIDLITVTVDLKNSGLIDSVGGPIEITKLTRKVSSAANIEQYARILTQAYIRRELIRVSSEMVSLSYNEAVDLDEIMKTYETAVDNIDRIIIGKNTGREFSKVLKDLSEEISRRAKLSEIGGITGITTGFGVLNKYTSGWQPNWLVIFAARPAMGKTAIAINRFAKEAAKSGKWVNIFSLEMDDISLAERLVIGASGIDTYNFKAGRLSTEDWRAYNRAVGELEKLPIFIDDSPYVKISHIRNVARANKRLGKCDMIIIDYLQLADSGDTKKNRNREQEVSDMSRALKALAKELHIPIIVLSQLSRAVESRSDRRPVMSDLRESGAIEQDADMVIFPYRPGYYKGKEDVQYEDTSENEGILIVAKNRHGATGDIRFYHNDTMTDFSDEPFNSDRYSFDNMRYEKDNNEF